MFNKTMRYKSIIVYYGPVTTASSLAATLNVCLNSNNVEMDGVGAADGSKTEPEDGQEAVIDVDADETESEYDLDVPVTDAANNDIDEDQLYMEIFDSITVT
eukprot:jgi/Phyca11/14080/fgenesh1_pg.PHYCAscaffold_6_\